MDEIMRNPLRPIKRLSRVHASIETTVCLLLVTSQLSAQSGETKLFPLDGAADDHFGQSVAVSDGFAVIGSPEDDDSGLNSGSAYVFEWDGSAWLQEPKLLASDGAAGDLFGSAVDVNGNRAIVGASGVGADRGAAYIYRSDGSTWTEEAILIPSNGAGGDYFGSSVSIDGIFAIVGAYAPSSASGAVYVFRRTGAIWDEVAVLTASDGSASDYFGVSVSLNGNYALVGAWWDDDNGLNSGSAYVFRYDGFVWSETAKLIAADGATDDYFGFSVSISGILALIGSYGDDDGGSGSGSAYIFRRMGTDWVEEAKLNASDAASSDFFGYSVELDGEYALVGSPFDDDRGGSSGAAYLFYLDNSDWRERRKFVAADGSESDNLGLAVALSDSFAIAGAHNDDPAGSGSGSAYVHSGFGVVTSVVAGGDAYPSDSELLQNYPNPFNSISNFEFGIAKLGDVSLKVFDILGREVATIVNEKLSPGAYTRQWDAAGLSSGVYYYRLAADGFVQTKRLVLLR